MATHFLPSSQVCQSSHIVPLLAVVLLVLEVESVSLVGRFQCSLLEDLGGQFPLH